MLTRKLFGWYVEFSQKGGLWSYEMSNAVGMVVLRRSGYQDVSDAYKSAYARAISWKV